MSETVLSVCVCELCMYPFDAAKGKRFFVKAPF